MPFKHEVTDKTGRVHKRITEERQYIFAVVRHYDRAGAIGAEASWCSRRDLAEKQMAEFARYRSTTDIEVIPCTPVATGKHSQTWVDKALSGTGGTKRQVELVHKMIRGTE